MNWKESNMEENVNPVNDQSREAMEKATKRRQLEERRAAYYEKRAHEIEEEQRRAQEAQEKANQAKQKMMALIRQKQMSRTA